MKYQIKHAETLLPKTKQKQNSLWVVNSMNEYEQIRVFYGTI